MKVKKLSKSAIDCYKECEWKYFLKYICGLQEPTGRAACIGNIVHKVFEILAQTKKTGHYLLNDKYTDKNYLMNIVFARYQKTNPELNLDEKDKKSAIKLMNNLATFYDPLKQEILGTEQGFEIEIQKPGFEYKYDDEEGYLVIHGYIDLLSSINNQTIEIIDYKTGKDTDWVTGEQKTQDNLNKDLQLQMYDLACSLMYPDKDRLLTIVYLKKGQEISTCINAGDRQNLINKLRVVFNSIMNNKNPIRLKEDEDKKKQKFKCNFCYFEKDGSCNKLYGVLKKEGYEKTIHAAKLTISAKKRSDRKFGLNNKYIYK